MTEEEEHKLLFSEISENMQRSAKEYSSLRAAIKGGLETFPAFKKTAYYRELCKEHDAAKAEYKYWVEKWADFELGEDGYIAMTKWLS